MPTPNKHNARPPDPWSWAFVVYREIPGFALCCAGSDGSLWSKRRFSRWHNKTAEWRRLRPYVDPNGYAQTSLIDDSGKARHSAVHSFVMLAFFGKTPRGLLIRHLNGISGDNRISNLAWGKPVQNSADMIEHGRSTRDRRAPGLKIADSDVPTIRQLKAAGLSQEQIASRFGVSRELIRDILSGKRRHWVA